MSEEEKLKLLYDRYNKCRDLELDRFWKNSVFVWVFLALCYGAFGKIVMDYLSNEKDPKICKDTCVVILAVISFFGFFMSKIWIWMARGLKAWYEVYETAIWDLESKRNIIGFDPQYTIENYWSVKTNGLRPFNSDRISPSRIVILIGRLMSCSWGISFIIWLYKSCNSVLFKTHLPKMSSCWTFWGVIIGFGILIGLCYLFTQSTTLRDSDENEMYWKIRGDMKTKPKQEKKQDDSSKKLPYSYFEIKDGEIIFYCSDEKNKNDIEQYMKANFTKISWIKKLWRIIKNKFRFRKDVDGSVLIYKNLKLSK